MTVIDHGAPTPTHAATRLQRAAYRTLRVLILPCALLGLVGATYFTFFAPAADGGVVTTYDWFVGLWKITVSLALLAVAVGPGLSRSQRLAVATWAVPADLAFSIIKIVQYHESAAVPFLAVDLVLLGLLAIVGRPDRSE
jgi:hypothetical protein